MDATVQKKDLRRYMRSRAPDSSLAHPARALLGRYLEIIEACEWPLKAPSKIDARAYAAHLSRVLSVPVNAVLVASATRPYDDVAWTTPEGLALLVDDGLSAGLDASIEDDFARTYWGCLQLSMERRMLGGLGEARVKFLGRDVKTRLMGGLRQALYATLAGPISVRRVEQCVCAVEDTLRDFLAMTVMDDRLDGVPLGHVVRMMTAAIPLGAKRGDPGTWIVLAA
ncbi:MAG: hypothetical protein RL272_1348 [Candidatus Parcubacteria bacterium]|jgi:hypothetical protein